MRRGIIENTSRSVSDTELRISDVLDALPFYVLLIDEDHHILQANVAVRDQLGFEPEAIIGKYCPKIIYINCSI